MVKIGDGPAAGRHKGIIPEAPFFQKFTKGSGTVLLVDDEPQIVALFEKQLESAGYRVASFTGSKEALEHFRSDPGRYDLVITDMTMPELTGDKLAAELKVLRPEIPVIITSGYHERLTPELITSLGIQTILLKPIGRQDLLKTLRGILG